MMTSHVKLGDTIDLTKQYTKQARNLAYFGYLVVLIAVLIILVEVIL